MANELISVIIPIYNSEQYLERCLNSVLCSTYTALEVICVNDGSTDGSAAILERFARDDSRIQILTDENGGLSAARNRGLNVASGAYVSFVDSDDQIHPRMFELLHDAMKQNACALATCDYRRPTDAASPEEAQPVDGSNCEVLKAEQLYHFRNQKGFVWGKLYLRDLIGNIRFVEQRGIIEDVLFNAEVLTKDLDMKVSYLKDPMYFYSDTPGSLIHQINWNSMVITVEAYFRILEGIRTDRAKRIILRETMKMLLSLRNSILKSSCRTLLKQTKQMLRSAVSDYCALTCVSKKEKLVYQTMLYVPATYSVGAWLVKKKNKLYS